MDKTDETEFTLAREWKRFAETTSIKTVPKALRSKTWCLRLVWLMALIFGVAVATYQSYIIMSTYLQYKTSLNIVEIYESPPFPDITICKMNPPPTFRSDDLNMFIDKVGKEVDYYDSDYDWSDIDSQDTLGIVDDLGSLSGYFQTINSSEIQLQNINDFVIQCSFTTWNSVRQNCTLGHNEKSWYLTPEYPTCITIKQNDTNRDNLLGFTGILYMNDFEILSAPNFEISLLNSQASGVKVFLSERGSYPNLLLGAPVSVGTQGNIRISSARIKRLGPPYGECTNEYKGYSKTQCENTCKQQYMLDHCQCLDPDTPTTLELRNQHIYCGALEGEEHNISRTLTRMNCRKNKLQELHDTCRKQCPPPCEEYSFTYDKLDASWPHESRHMALYRDYIRPRHGLSDDISMYYEHIDELIDDGYLEEAFEQLRNTNLITRNFLQINIHFDDEKVTLYTDTALMTAAALFGQLGGILNLWIGITFVTLVEFGEFLYYAAVVIGYKAKMSTSKVHSFKNSSSDTKNDIFSNKNTTDYGNMGTTIFSKEKSKH